MKFKRGTRFLHAKWLGEDMKPLLCEVARVANGVIYWKQPGERKAKYYFALGEASKYVKETL